jgi:hypothetical protein
MAILQVHFGYPKSFGINGMFVGPLFNPFVLDQQSFFVKLTMEDQCQLAMQLPLDGNPITKM